MIVRKPDRLIRRSSWPPGTWLLPDLGEYMYRRHGTQFSWHDPTQALCPTPLYSFNQRVVSDDGS
jgi:hypothetical protein